MPIENESLRRRFEWKRDQDLSEIFNRIEQVSVERAYRIVGALEKHAQEIEDYYVPQIRDLIGRWRRQVLTWDAGWLLLAVMPGGVVIPARAAAKAAWTTSASGLDLPGCSPPNTSIWIS